MNSKITQTLSDVSSGDITAYFNEVDKIIVLFKMRGSFKMRGCFKNNTKTL